MELDELKTAWHELNQRLDAERALNRSVRTELKLDKMRSALRRSASLLVYELVVDVVAALLLGSFLADNLHVARFAVPALVLHVVAVIGIGTSVWQLAMIGGIDYAASVITIQRRLAKLRVWRIRFTLWLMLLVPLLWTPLAIVAAQGLFGFDIYRGFGLPWVASNLGFGLAAIPLMLWLARRYADRLSRSRILGRLADDIAGRSLTRAMGFVDEIARFEEE